MVEGSATESMSGLEGGGDDEDENDDEEEDEEEDMDKVEVRREGIKEE